MSVINQMLRDLDARDAGELERAGLPPRLRPLPPVTQIERQSWRMLGLGLAAGAALAGSVALLLRPDDAPQAPARPPVIVPVPAAPVVPVVPADAAMAPADAGEMKMSTLLSLAQLPQQDSPPSAERAPAPPAPNPAVVAPVATPQPPAPTAPSVKSAPKAASEPAPPPPPAPKATPTPKPAPPEASNSNGQIDKRAKGGGQGREMAESEYRKGMQAVKRGDNAAAQPLFQRALEFDPGMAKARQALLSVLVGARQWAEAQQYAQGGLDLDPTQTGWAMILARLQFEQSDATGALLTLEKHAAHAQADADYHGLFAYLLQKQQRPAEAAEHFQIAVNLRPNEGRWWFGLGLSLEGAGRAAEAKDAFQKARSVGNLSADMSAVIEQKLK